MKPDPRYPRIALIMAMAAAWPVQALAVAGLVQFTSGQVSLRRGENTTRLERGAQVDAGDVILTGSAGRAQIRFTDGGLVALYPDSQFTVTRYTDSGNPAQDAFVVNLLRGGLRAVTGLIGKRDPGNYRVITPTAVVGIRGSAFLVTFNSRGQVMVAGEQDEIEVCTSAGCVGVKAGESVLVLSDHELPVYTNTRALLPVPQPQKPDAAGEQLRGDGSRSGIVVMPPSVPPPSPPAPQPPVPPAPQPPAPPPPAPQPPVPTPPAPPPEPQPPAPTPPAPTPPPPPRPAPPPPVPPPTTAPPTTVPPPATSPFFPPVTGASTTTP